MSLSDCRRNMKRMEEEEGSIRNEVGKICQERKM